MNTTEPDTTVADERPRASDGRVPGRRGQATRRRLLDSCVDMLGSTSYRDIKVVDIARAAGTSPATFYQYFPDVESAMLVVGEEMVEEGVAEFDRLTSMQSWDGPDAFEQVEELTKGFLRFWEANIAVLRVIDLATGEGDQRFADMRLRLLGQLNRSLTRAVERQQSEGGGQQGLDPGAVGGVIVSMLAHVAAHRRGFEFHGVESRELRRTMSRIIHWAITGAEPPA